MTNYRQTMADALEFMYLMREYKLMERELTDDEKKRREEIAKDMDDADFKERYGDRWKEVKMAVATKQAKNESVDLDEWTVSDVEIAMKKKYGKVDKEAIEKLKKVQHRGNVDRNDLVKVGHGKLNVESVDLDEVTKWKMGDGRPRGGSHIENVRFWDLPKDELQYIMKDAGEAMKANPTGRKAISGPGNYADQVNDAQTVLYWRKKNGIKEDVGLGEARQLKNPKKEVMVVKSGKVIVIDKKDAKEYLNKGWDLAEEVELDEAKPEYEVKYAKSKSSPIMVTKFMTFDQAKKYLADVKKDGMNGIISKGGKPVKEEVELDEVFNGTKQDIRKITRATDNALKKRLSQIQKMLRSKTNEKGKGLTDFEFDHISDEGDAINAELVYRKKGGKDPISDVIPSHLKKFVNEEIELDEGKKKQIEVGSSTVKAIGKETTARGDQYWWQGKSGMKNVYSGKDAKEKFRYSLRNVANQPNAEKLVKQLDEVVELDEDNMDLMRKAAKGAVQTLKMKDGKLKMDSFTASGIMQVYDKVNSKNKISMEKMINTGNKSQIAKLQALAMKASKGGRREDVDLGEELLEGRMKELYMLIKKGKSAEEIAKIMKVDVKIIKSFKTDFDESAHSDAMKAIAKDKDLGKRSDVEDNDSASDVDIKAASKNIIMQMRKVLSLRGNFMVEFGDKKKIKIPEKIAVAVQEKYNSFRKPKDKIKFAEKVAKSYKSMLSALKENTILDRIGKKIQERKEILEVSNKWVLANKKFSLINDKGTYILVTQGTGEEKKLKAKTPQDATQELVKKGYREF